MDGSPMTPAESIFVFVGLLALGWLAVVVLVDRFAYRRRRRLSRHGGSWVQRLADGGSLSWRDDKGRRL